MKRYFVLYGNQSKSFSGNIFQVMWKVYQLEDPEYVIVTRIGESDGL